MYGCLAALGQIAMKHEQEKREKSEHRHDVRDLLRKIHCTLERMAARLEQNDNQGEIIMADLTALTAEVHRSTTVSTSVAALVAGLAAKIEVLKNDPVALSALAAELKANNDAVSAAVLANTPVEEPPVAPAEPPVEPPVEPPAEPVV